MLEKIKDIKLDIENFIGRGINGYGKKDLWDFDAYLSKTIIKGLGEFKQVTDSKPAHLTKKEWKYILNQIQVGFDAHLKLISLEYIESGKEEEWKIKEKDLKADYEHGMGLFKKYFGSLWL